MWCRPLACAQPHGARPTRPARTAEFVAKVLLYAGALEVYESCFKGVVHQKSLCPESPKDAMIRYLALGY